MSRRIDLTGKVFGELTVIGYSHSHVQPSGQKRAMWDVVCSCGVEKQISTSNLAYGHTISCGHVLVEKRRTARKLPGNDAEKNYLYLSYRNSAKNRKIEFDLCKDDFLSLVEKDCCYCGSGPSNTRNSKSTLGSPYRYNGLDRVDNNIGYNISNVVTCCKACNYMKRAMTYNEFIDQAKRIIAHAEKRK